MNGVLRCGCVGALRWVSWRLLLLAIGVGVAAPAAGSLLERLSLDSLRARADGVVLARVISTRGLSTGRTIETETVLSIERSWRGPTRGTLPVRTPGGAVGDLRMIVRGTPSFTPGERVLVFLYRSGAGWRTVGMFQGVWRLAPSSDFGASLALDESSLAWPSPAAGARLVALRPGPYAVDGGPRPLSELVGDLER